MAGGGCAIPQAGGGCAIPQPLPHPCLASPRLDTFGSLTSARFCFPLRWTALTRAVCASKPGSSFQNALIFSL